MTFVAAVLAVSLAVGGWLGIRYGQAKHKVETDLDWLARLEADRDVWEPDELWPLQKLTDPATPPAGVSVTPTAAEASATAGGGGHLLRDELIEELVSEYRTKLYEWFR